MPYTKGFKKLMKGVEKQYSGKPVPSKFRNKYGKRYDKNETKSISYAIAKSRGIKIH